MVVEVCTILQKIECIIYRSRVVGKGGGGFWSADCLLSPMYSPADITFVVARQLIHRLSTIANKYGRDHPIHTVFHSQIVINR